MKRNKHHKHIKKQMKTQKVPNASSVKQTLQPQEIVMKLFNLNLGQFWESVLHGDIGFVNKDNKKYSEGGYKILHRGGHSGNTSPYSRPSEIAIILHSEIDYISRCILDYKRIETGGQLFGHWTADGAPIVLYAIGPGPNANHQSAFFNQDIDYLETVGRFLYERYGLHHIGEWHSHHQLGLAHPSGHDASTMVDSIRDNHLGRFLLCIGNCTDVSSTLNAFNFTEDAGYDYVQAKWLVKESEGIPYRELIDRDLDRYLVHPHTERPCHGELSLVNNLTNQNTQPEYAKSYWFNEKENRIIFKTIMDKLRDHSGKECSIQMDENGFIHLTVHYDYCLIRIFFPERFPQSAPDITLIDNYSEETKFLGGWSYTGDIYDSFIHYYNQILQQIKR